LSNAGIKRKTDKTETILSLCRLLAVGKVLCRLLAVGKEDTWHPAVQSGNSWVTILVIMPSA